MNSIWLAFLTGLTTGGLSCLAVQGGLLASSIQASEVGQSNDSGTQVRHMSIVERWRHVGVFLIAKLIGYTYLGFLLGLLGSAMSISPKIMGYIQVAAGIYMVATAARLLNVHPIFRYVVVQPPKSVYQLLKRRAKDPTLFGPAVMGFLTILMPCGVTQATMAIAIASGRPLEGAAIMGAFVLGTSPIFFALGASVTELLKRKAFAYVAAVVVLLFGVLSINGGIGLTGSFYTLQNIYRAATTGVDELAEGSGAVAGTNSQGVQDVTITVGTNGYQASATTLKAGVPVKLTMKSIGARGCVRAFTIPDLNISKVLPENGTETLEFIPNKPGRLAYSCSMGMYTGAFIIQ